MTLYHLYSQFPCPVHPEDAARVEQDNTGQKYYIERTEDEHGEYSNKVYCYDSLQEAWQAALDNQECFINEVKERKEWLLSKALQNGYVPPVESPAAKIAREYARAWTVEYHRLMTGA
jgi:hypothetical protein